MELIGPAHRSDTYPVKEGFVYFLFDLNFITPVRREGWFKIAERWDMTKSHIYEGYDEMREWLREHVGEDRFTIKFIDYALVDQRISSGYWSWAAVEVGVPEDFEVLFRMRWY